jgi:hypothetical protein
MDLKVYPFLRRQTNATSTFRFPDDNQFLIRTTKYPVNLASKLVYRLADTLQVFGTRLSLHSSRVDTPSFRTRSTLPRFCPQSNLFKHSYMVVLNIHLESSLSVEYLSEALIL